MRTIAHKNIIWLYVGLQVAEHDESLFSIFPQTTADDQERFRTMDYVYIGARYGSSFSISAEDLQILAKCVRQLLERTEALCREQIQRWGRA